MADRFSIYNMALAHLRERRLASLNEAREPRRVLDDFWDAEVGYCLERHMWNFMYRTVQIDAETALVPQFGFLYAFRIPNDWVRTRAISAVQTLEPPLLQLREEAGFWYTNITPIFVQYNSDDPLYGMDLGAWPASFANWVAFRLAVQTCGKITGSETLLQGPQGLMKREENARKVAAANAAMNDPVGFAPQSSWVRARRGFSTQIPGPGGDEPAGGQLIP